MSEYDLVVVGAGPGGYVAAIRGSQLGLKTAVVERDKVGGRCLNYACIPAKAVLRSADVLSDARSAAGFGIVTGEVSVDFAAVSKHRQAIVKTLTGGVAGLLKKNSVDVVKGAAQLSPDGSLLVDGDRFAAKHILLATGSVPKALGSLDFSERVLTTEQAWALSELPGRLAVVGAGASGVAIASAFGRLGSEGLLFEAAERVVPTEDVDISKSAGKLLAKQNIAVLTGVCIDETTSEGRTTLRFGSETEAVDFVVIATGRAPDIAGLGLAEAGVQFTDCGLISVDGSMRTSVGSIYAVGDLVPGPALAHKASDEGVIAVESMAGLSPYPLEYGAIPRATFCSPNIASFGLTEAQARTAGHDVTVGKVQYAAVGAATVYGDRTGLVKIVGDTRYGEILGAHIIGAKATEMIQELVNLKALDGVYQEAARIVHGHPTLSEAVMEAARAADGWLIHG